MYLRAQRMTRKCNILTNRLSRSSARTSMSRRAFGLACGILRMQKSSDRPLANAVVRLRKPPLMQCLYRGDPKTALTGGAEHSRASCMANTLTLSRLAQTGHQPAGDTWISRPRHSSSKLSKDWNQLSQSRSTGTQDWY